jgi:hypothetical protein
MLGLIGVICYISAAISAAVAINGLASHGVSDFSVSFAIASAVGSAFFGAVCFVLDEIRDLLVKIASGERHEVPVASYMTPTTKLPEAELRAAHAAAVTGDDVDIIRYYEAKLDRRNLAY